MHALFHLASCAATKLSRASASGGTTDQQPKASDIQIGVLGLGVMGKTPGQAEALGFKVAGWSASPKPLPT